MALEATLPFRLWKRGGPGLACDDEGISLGGIALATLDAESDGARRYVIRSVSELEAILSAAFGSQRQDAIQRCHRGLRWLRLALQRMTRPSRASKRSCLPSGT